MSAEQAASALREDLNSFVRAELERAFNEALNGEIEEGMRRGLTSKWSKPYPKLVSLLLGKDDSMFRFYEFPKAMWKSIYTSNVAESPAKI